MASLKLEPIVQVRPAASHELQQRHSGVSQQEQWTQALVLGYVDTLVRPQQTLLLRPYGNDNMAEGNGREWQPM